MQAETKYSLAKHVEFYALDVGETIKVVVFYFTLDDEKRLGGQVYTSVNGVALEQGACASMQALIDALPEPLCLVSFPLCQPQISFVNGIRAVSYAIPAPLTGDISTNIILNVTDTNPRHEQELTTSLNFKLSASSSVCLASVATLHDPMQWAQVDVHTTSATGLMGPARTLAGTGAYGTLLTETSDVHSAEVMSQALFTLVVRAKDSAQAQQYFDGTTQVLQLDDVLMSHAIGESPGLPAAPSRVAPDAHNKFRSRIEFTGSATCPCETAVAAHVCVCPPSVSQRVTGTRPGRCCARSRPTPTTSSCTRCSAPTGATASRSSAASSAATAPRTSRQRPSRGTMRRHSCCWPSHIPGCTWYGPCITGCTRR